MGKETFKHVDVAFNFEGMGRAGHTCICGNKGKEQRTTIQDVYFLNDGKGQTLYVENSS